MSINDVPPSAEIDPYDQTILGYIGQMGTGESAIRYMKTLIKVEVLDKLTLVSDLPGSESWPIRELFQRDIDVDRVTNEILPYFYRTDRIKFFNPLTLAILPIGSNSQVKKNASEAPIADLTGAGKGYDHGLAAKGLYELP